MVGLSLITLGIYFFFWWYFVNRELRDLGRARGVDLGQKPGNSVLAASLGALIVVPAIVTMWTTSGRVEASQAAAGLEQRASGPVIFILMLLIGPVGMWYAQSELNKVWERQAREPGGSALPAAEPGGAATPPRPAAEPEAVERSAE